MIEQRVNELEKTLIELEKMLVEAREIIIGLRRYADGHELKGSAFFELIKLRERSNALIRRIKWNRT